MSDVSPIHLSEIHAISDEALHDKLISYADQIESLQSTVSRLREALDRVLQWWPENSENGRAADSYGHGFRDDIRNAREALKDIYSL